MTDTAPPDGCTHCGIDARDHAQRWTRDVGWHGYVPPSDAQRLQRMQTRRTTTTTTRKDNP